MKRNILIAATIAGVGLFLGLVFVTLFLLADRRKTMDQFSNEIRTSGRWWDIESYTVGNRDGFEREFGKADEYVTHGAFPGMLLYHCRDGVIVVCGESPGAEFRVLGIYKLEAKVGEAKLTIVSSRNASHLKHPGTISIGPGETFLGGDQVPTCPDVGRAYEFLCRYSMIVKEIRRGPNQTTTG